MDLFPNFGAVHGANETQFALWAPGQPVITLALSAQGQEAMYAMQRTPDGWHCVSVADARPGDRYVYVLPDGRRVPDPASRFQPDDVHGPSELVDTAHPWRCNAWRGRPWTEAVIYELDVGTFTPEGTFEAARERLAELVSLGITAIELMPLADFPGRRGWGYDGVLPFAPDASYGTPRELREFIDAAHVFDMMVLLDVVYNHFGPEGNYLPTYCPEFFNPAHQTPWGDAINFDGPHAREVRRFFVQNALYWIDEFRFDGLRLDAVHALRDDSPQSIVQEICDAVRKGPGAERHVHVILENEDNRATWLDRDPNGQPVTATAQWNDDLHHAVHVLATGESEGYFADYQTQPIELLGKALAEGFIFQGQPSTFLKGRHRGEPSGHLPGPAFVSFLQTHDQIGNRARGERIHALGDEVLLRAARACVLLSPHIPMFFMGEEYAASTPFQFFCDFGPELAAAVTEGRRKEFAHFASFGGSGAETVPDPNEVSTFLASKLDWAERERPAHAAWLAEARRLLALRHVHIVPLLLRRPGGARWRVDQDGTLRLQWDFAAGEGPPVRLHLIAQMGQGNVRLAAPAGRVVLAAPLSRSGSGAELHLERGAVHCTLEEDYRG